MDQATAEPGNHRAFSASALVIAASDKAGMEGIDRKRINDIIMRESQGTAYMLKQKKQDERTNVKIDQMKERRKKLSLDEECRIRSSLEPELSRLFASRNQLSTKVVLDMDSFYVSASLLSKDDEFKKRPVCVSGGSIISTSNYCARRYGVRSAMPSWIGNKLVEELSGGREKLIHLPCDFDLYTKIAQEVRNIIAEYDPKFRAYSLDEAYIELGPYIKLRRQGITHNTASTLLKSNEISESQCPDDLPLRQPQTPIDIHITVHQIRTRVFETTGLTCSAGIAPNFMLAKVASDRNKPNGQCFVDPSENEVNNFIRNLPIRKIPGIGRVTEKILNSFEINTVRDLYSERALIQYLFKPATSSFLLRASIGWNDNPSHEVENEDDKLVGRKGISRERTFSKKISIDEIKVIMENTAKILSEDMLNKGISARTITLKIKLHTFDILCRSKSLPKGCFLQNSLEMNPLLNELLMGLYREHKSGDFIIRLLGVRCSNLVSNYSSGQSRIDLFLNKQKFVGCSTSNHLLNEKEKGNESKIDMEPVLKKQRLQNQANFSQIDGRKQLDNNLSNLCCPLCGKVFTLSENKALNSHLDSCLSHNTVRKVAQQETMNASKKSQTRKKLKISNYFQLA